MNNDGFKSIDWINATLDLEVHGLPVSAKLMLVCIARYADADGASYPSIGRLAAMVGVSKRQIGNLLGQLSAAGLVEVARGKSPWRTNVYRLKGFYPQPRKSASGSGGQPYGEPRNSRAVDREIQFVSRTKRASTNQVLNNQKTKESSIPQHAAQALPSWTRDTRAALDFDAHGSRQQPAPLVRDREHEVLRLSPMSPQTKAKVAHARGLAVCAPEADPPVPLRSAGNIEHK